MDLDDGVPLLKGHVEHHAVPEDAGVVHDRVEPAPRVQGEADQRLGAGLLRHVLEVGNGLTAGGGDLPRHLRGGPVVCPGAVPLTAKVVHDHPRALLGEQERFAAADASARAGDQGHLPVQHRHEEPPSPLEAEPYRKGEGRSSLPPWLSSRSLEDLAARGP